MIDLREQRPFASGGNRHCYRHPEHPERCIKVMIPGRVGELRARAPWYKKLFGDDQFDDNAREREGYHQKALKNAAADSIVWQHLPRWYGIEDTSAGPGSVSELILDSSGEPAMTLERYLQLYGLDETIRRALSEFADWLRLSGVMTKNLLPHNLVIRETRENPRLVLIDGLGRSAFLPFAEIFEGSRNRYLERRIKRMWARVEWETSDRAMTWEEAEDISRRR
ncbi:YrbL family protein [Microbulbifer sp. ALW1]|uniref:YrbL family protein n=1 Tax=Microbulbifer sp. (strain ALW1) TaxID=1516059 RepID=UPI001357F3CE|nr:YrbL family protein [Microbulbifer sp. ALW1]